MFEKGGNLREDLEANDSSAALGKGPTRAEGSVREVERHRQALAGRLHPRALGGQALGTREGKAVSKFASFFPTNQISS